MCMYVWGGVYKPNREENRDVMNSIDSFSSETAITLFKLFKFV